MSSLATIMAFSLFKMTVVCIMIFSLSPVAVFLSLEPHLVNVGYPRRFHSAFLSADVHVHVVGHLHQSM